MLYVDIMFNMIKLSLYPNFKQSLVKKYIHRYFYRDIKSSNKNNCDRKITK